MVVPYATASEGSWASFFIVTPRVLCKRRGSIIPKVFPQVLLAVSFAVIARWWNPIVAEDAGAGLSIMGVLLSFLVVFKTHSAYAQFWDAVTQTEKMLQLSRNIVMSAVTLFPFDNPGLDASRPTTSMGASRPDAEEGAWAGGLLRLRVLAAYQLLERDWGKLGNSSDPYTVVWAGRQTFSTKVVNNDLNPVWDSDIFDFNLDAKAALVNFEVRDSDFSGHDKLGWLHLTQDDLLGLVHSRWQRIRRRLQDGGPGELELELHFTPAARLCGRALTPPRCGSPFPWSPADLPEEGAPEGGEDGEERVRALLRDAGVEACAQRLLGAGFASLAFLECASDADMAEAGLLPAERALLRRRLRKREEAAAALRPPERDAAGGLPDEGMPVPAFLRRIVRLVALHYFVVVEYFRRTGENAITDPDFLDTMRRDIKMLTGEREYAMLYPDELRETPGSRAHNRYANPMVVLYWVQLTIGSCAAVHKVPPPIVSSFVPQVSGLAEAFWEMQKIDKLQFPLPYAQVVKLVCFTFVLLVPWVLQPKCREITEIVVGLIALGFFGLDEVAEIMESPFGNDPNHIDLRSYGQDLLDDLEVMYYSRNRQLDSVLTETQSRSSRRLFDSRLRNSFGSADFEAVSRPERMTPRKLKHELNLKTMSGNVPNLRAA